MKAKSLACVVIVLTACTHGKPVATSARTLPCLTLRSGAGGSARLIVGNIDGNDLYLFDVSTCTKRMITHDGPKALECAPVFHGASRITFSDCQNTIRELDLRSGRAVVISKNLGGVAGHRWSPDGSTLALVAGDPVNAYTKLGERGRTRLLRPILPEAFSGDYGQFDESDVRWSADGKKVLIIYAYGASHHAEYPEKVFVVGLRGQDLVEPIDATFARWLSSDRILFERYRETGNVPGSWVILDLASGAQRVIHMVRGARPAVSPNGTKIAFDDGEAHLFVYDVARDDQLQITSDHVAPIWLRDDTIAATRTESCKGGPCLYVAPWQEAGAVDVFALDGRQTGTLPIGSTSGVDILYR